MWISIREKFSQDNPGWDSYFSFIGIPKLSEVRSIDANLNSPITPPIFIPTRNLLNEAILHLPTFDKTRYYIQIAVNHSTETTPDIIDTTGMSINLLGYDLSDETETSSVLNCGQWAGKLLPFISRLNKYGLLTHSDALIVQELLPQEWNNDPHSFVDIWEIFEVNYP